MVTRYWVNFVRAGDPNGSGPPLWPRFDGQTAMEFGDAFAPKPILSDAKRAAYRAYVAKRGPMGGR